MTATRRIAAVAFDYGNVIAYQHEGHRATLMSLTGLSSPEFDRRYVVDRLAYDRGTLSGEEYWTRLLNGSGVPATPNLIADLVRTDAASWLSHDPRALSWVRQLREAGLMLAVLSNMPKELVAALREAHSEWLSQFSVTIFSSEIGCVKPEGAIYTRLLDDLGLPGDRVLFLDDVRGNIDAAIEAGLEAIHYDSFDTVMGIAQSRYALPAAD